MAEQREVQIPDIGDFEEVDVIEVLVAPGDEVAAEQSLITLESEKATMEIPAPWAGVVVSLHVAVGDKVSQGARILTLGVDADAPAASAAAPAPPQSREEPRPALAAAPASETAPVSSQRTAGATPV